MGELNGEVELIEIGEGGMVLEAALCSVPRATGV